MDPPRKAFTFFRGRPKVQARPRRLIDVGLDNVRLGQPANTLCEASITAKFLAEVLEEDLQDELA